MKIFFIDPVAVAQIFGLMIAAFLVAFALTPVLTHFLYRFKLDKKIRQKDLNGNATPVFNALHADKENTPTMGGVLIWIVVAAITLLFNFSRSQTWLPLFTLILVAILGAVDDLINISGARGGMRSRHKMIWLVLISAVGAWWFFSKLGFSAIDVPFYGNFEIGLWYIPLFMFVIIASANAVNFTDGLDGLAGGLLVFAFLTYTGIAFFEGHLALAGFCATTVGALLAFLWFNIYPARFFMGDTGSMALGATLGVIAMLTNTALVLPIIGLVFVIETLSVIVQLISKKFWHKKVFLSSPLHHHFEAKGWPETKVTMRFWVIGAMMAVVGLVIALLGKGF